MDRISYTCANKINDDLACFYQSVCKRNLKVWRYPVNSNGGHYCDEYIDDLYYYDEPEDMWDDTVIAPNWDELRQMLNALEPSFFILSEFEAIESIDEYAYKLKDYYLEHKR
jgi:hypothetical protein